MGGYRQYKIETKHLRIILLKESIFAELLIIFFRPLIFSDVVKYNCNYAWNPLHVIFR